VATKKPAAKKAKKAKTAKHPGGRPAIYSSALADKICERLAEGESLVQICKDDKMPGRATVMRWLEDSSPVKVEFRDKYARAREAQAEKYAAEIVEIADETVIEATYLGEEVRLDVSSAAVARNRLRVDARKWIAAKLLPKKYGDKLAIGGADDLPPVQSNVTMTPAEAYKAILGG